MSEEVKKYLLDIRDSIESIYEYLGEQRDFNNYRKNKGLRRSIERELEIIGLALKNALDMQPDLKITDRRKIIGTRNIVAHTYDKVQDTKLSGALLLTNYPYC